jgi:uncharacterized protein YbcC (UPF0753/DUF2309 family)
MASVDDPGKKTRSLYKLSIKFFREYLKLNKEVTQEDILKLLKKEQADFFKFSEPLSESIYSKKSLTEKELEVLSEEFKKIIEKNEIPLEISDINKIKT